MKCCHLWNIINLTMIYRQTACNELFIKISFISLFNFMHEIWSTCALWADRKSHARWIIAEFVNSIIFEKCVECNQHFRYHWTHFHLPQLLFGVHACINTIISADESSKWRKQEKSHAISYADDDVTLKRCHELRERKIMCSTYLLH